MWYCNFLNSVFLMHSDDRYHDEYRYTTTWHFSDNVMVYSIGGPRDFESAADGCQNSEVGRVENPLQLDQAITTMQQASKRKVWIPLRKRIPFTTIPPDEDQCLMSTNRSVIQHSLKWTNLTDVNVPQIFWLESLILNSCFELCVYLSKKSNLVQLLDADCSERRQAACSYGKKI